MDGNASTMKLGRRAGSSAIQSNCGVISCLGMRTETTRCGDKWVKATSWWNQLLNHAIQAKKVVYKACLQRKPERSFHARHAAVAVRKSAAFAVKRSKLQSWENFAHQLDSSHRQASEAEHPVCSACRSNFRPMKWLKPIARYLRLNRFDQWSASFVISDRGILSFGFHIRLIHLMQFPLT